MPPTCMAIVAHECSKQPVNPTNQEHNSNTENDTDTTTSDTNTESTGAALRITSSTSNSSTQPQLQPQSQPQSQSMYTQYSTILGLVYGLLHEQAKPSTHSAHTHGTCTHNSEMLQGGLLIICTKVDIPIWSRLMKSIPSVSSLIYSADTLAQRRKSGVNRLTRFDAVITTYESLKAKEVVLPMSFFDRADGEMLTKTGSNDSIE